MLRNVEKQIPSPATQETAGYDISCCTGTGDSLADRELYLKIFTAAVLLIGSLTFGIYALMD